LLSAVVGTVRLAWGATGRGLLAVSLLAIGAGLLPPAIVAMSRALVDLVARSRSHAVTFQELAPFGLGLAMLVSTNRVINSMLGHRQQAIAVRVARHAEQIFLKQVARADMILLEDPAWQDQLERVSSGLSFRPSSLTQQLTSLLGAAVTLLGMMVVLLRVNPVLLVMVAASILIPLPFHRRMNGRIHAFHQQVTSQQRERQYYRSLLTKPASAKEIRALVLEEHLLRRHRLLAEEYEQRHAHLYRNVDRVAVLSGLLGGLVLAATYLFVARKSELGTLSPGDVTALIAAVASVATHANSISAALLGIDQHARFLSDFFQFLEIPSPGAGQESPRSLPVRLCGGIEIADVAFTFPGRGAPTLNGLNLEVKQGEMLAIVGENGSGKSTLVKILLRLYEPQVGTLRIGGIDIKQIDPIELRQRIGVMFQDHLTFPFTVRQAVGFGRSSRLPDDRAVWDALRTAGAEQIVRRLPGALDATIGRVFEGGCDLSGGEWQRMTLARLMFRQPDIWILDEPSSALDPEAEAALFAHLKSQARGGILIVISHRPSTVAIADRIAVMADGRIVEVGSHHELLARGGRYAHLSRLQAGVHQAPAAGRPSEASSP
jgi:ATP-binding cassette, subfamily B, bacterial